VVGERSERLQHDQPDRRSVEEGQCPDTEGAGRSETLPEPADPLQLLPHVRRGLHGERRAHLRPGVEIVEKRRVLIDELAHHESGGRNDRLIHAPIVPAPAASDRLPHRSMH